MFVGSCPLEQFVDQDLLPEYVLNPDIEGVFVHRNHQGVLTVYFTELDYDEF